MNIKEQLRKADVIGLALIAASLIAYSTRSIWNVYQTIATVVGAALVIASLAVKSKDIRAGLGRRSSKFGINSAISVVLFLAVLGLVNYLGAQHQSRIDLTTEKIYSLSEQSVTVAEQVNQDIRIKAFYPGGDYPPARELLDLYQARNSRITYEFIDPDKQPQTAQQYQVTVYGDVNNPMTGQQLKQGTLILEMGEAVERIEKSNEPVREEDITNALMKVVKGEKKTIYFTEGHGERGLESAERDGYGTAKAALEKENYVVKTVNLVREGKVPEDASVLAMIGPTTEPFPNELELIDAFLKNGGSVLITLDPPPNASLAEFLKKRSIDVGNNFVVDASGVGRLFGAGPQIPLVSQYGPHKITENFNVMTFFPLARSVSPITPAAEGVTVEQLIATSERSWGETDMKNPEASLDEQTDLAGPVPLAAVASQDLEENKKSRLIAYGDSDFGSNGFFSLQGNGNLFMNAMTWLAQDESFISIRPKNPEDRRLTMTESQGQLVSWISQLLLPGSILFAGISMWMKRRK